LQPPEFVLEDSFSFRLQGRDFVIGEPAPLVPQPAAVAKDLALAHTVQDEMDRDNLTCREVGPRHGFSRATVGRLVPLVRLAPDIQEAVSRLTTTTACERIDRESLEWVAEAMDWTEQRARFQELMNKYFEPEPARVAKALSAALELRKDIEEKQLTLAKAARRAGHKVERVRNLLALADLAPDIQKHILAMTTATASVNVTEPKRGLVAQAPTRADQRRLYEKLLAGQLRCTRKVKPPPKPTEEEQACSLEAIRARLAAEKQTAESAVMAFDGPFTLKQLRSACPSLSADFLSRTLRRLRSERRVRSSGAGMDTRWQKIVGSPDVHDS
jgi:hypothetical protein